MVKQNRVYAEIDLSAAEYNMEAMHNHISPTTKMIAVVKTNGYGHGAVRIARHIEKLPYLWGFAVATPGEAMELIEDGRNKPILILGISFFEQYNLIVANDIRPTICNYEMAEDFSKVATKLGKTCHVHIALDTGMGRIGFQANRENAKIIAQIAKLPNIDIEGIFTHFARADELSKEPVFEQMAKFDEMIAFLEEENVQIPFKHCSNSAGIVEVKAANKNLVRAGITLYGLWPSEEVSRDVIDLKPVMSIKSHVSFVKELEAGHAISYGGTYVTAKKTKIATIPVGYGDGYARGLSNKGYVLIHGKKAPICGRVCMDQFMVDVTEIEDVKPLDEVTLLGRDGDENITMEELGNLSGRFNYEFACLITDRVPRIYNEK